MKTAILITSLLSAVIFATIFLQPAADSHDAPKAWAHGVTYVLPRVIGTLLFGIASLVLTAIQMRRTGTRQTLRNPTVLLSILLLLPAAYTLAFIIRMIIAVTTDMNK